MLRNLILLEWKKVQGTSFLNLSIILYAALLILMLMVQGGANFGGNDVLADYYVFPNIFHTAAYFGSWLSFFFLTFITIQIIAGEHTYKTIRLNIIGGIERREYLLGKLLILFMFNFIATFYTMLVATVVGLLNGGNPALIGEGLLFMVALFLQNALYMSMLLLIATLVRRNILTVFIFFPYVLFMERLLRYLLFRNWAQDGLVVWSPANYLPASVAWDLLPPFGLTKLPGGAQMSGLTVPHIHAVITSVVYIGLFITLSFQIFRRQNL